MIKEFGYVHVIGECKDCDFYTDDFKNGIKKSYNHALRKKHYVLIESGKAGFYDGKGE